MAEQKLPWTFDRGGLNEELRKARSAEYIAHYLDRIEGQLARIADAAEAIAKKDDVSSALKMVVGAINRNAPR